MEHAVAEHEGITELIGKNGKTRYQAKVWYDNQFITSKTFDSLAVAKAFRTTKLAEAVKGTLLPAGERRKLRAIDTDLHRPMNEWATLYIEKNPAGHGSNRLYEYEQVGRLLADKALPDFSGKAGGRLIDDLAAKWRFIRFTRGTRAEPEHCPDSPVSDQTLRLRLSALDCLLDFAIEQLPDEVSYIGPVKLKNYAPPPAHSNKRKRLPTLDEYGALLRHFGPDSDFGDFLRVVDDTGCRLSEVSLARGAAVTFYAAAGHVLGGVLTLENHKTDADVGTRQIPLSRYAAQVLHARKVRYGDGKLFPALPSPNNICKAFDDARTALGIADLQVKDFRRGFITRNVRAVSKLELVTVVGQSSLIDLKSLSVAEQRTQKMAGHTDARTTLGYVTPEQEEMAQAFTTTSRWPAVSRLLRPTETTEPQVCEASVALERELGQLLARMRALGMTTAITAVS
jgi:integrase